MAAAPQVSRGCSLLNLLLDSALPALYTELNKWEQLAPNYSGDLAASKGGMLEPFAALGKVGAYLHKAREDLIHHETCGSSSENGTTLMNSGRRCAKFVPSFLEWEA